MTYLTRECGDHGVIHLRCTHERAICLYGDAVGAAPRDNRLLLAERVQLGGTGWCRWLIGC